MPSDDASARAPVVDTDIQRDVLFHARKDGYHTYRIPSIAVTAGRTVLALCEARKESPWDDGPIDIVMRRSLDGGETWLPQQVLIAGHSQTAHNAVMITDPGAAPAPGIDTTEVHLLYCIAYKRAFYTRSRDAGVTFDTPTEITHVFEQYRGEYDWSLIATGPGHGLRLRGGWLLVPVWLSPNTQQRPTMSSTIYSDDHGKSWQRGAIVVRDDDGQGVANPMEPVIVELQDGSIMLNVRNASPAQRRAVTISADGIGGWSPLRFDPQLHEPFCMSSLCRLALRPRDAHNAIIYTGPDDLAHAEQMGTANVGGCDRKRVTVKLSHDEGLTWPYARVLEPGWSGYSDLAVGADKAICCLYESGCIDNMMWDVQSLCLARFNERWVMQNDPAGNGGPKPHSP